MDKTSVPRGFTGPIYGRQVETSESLTIVDFERIDAEEPTVHCEGLSTDQKYLFDVHQAKIRGYCSPYLVHHSPGKMA